MAQKIYLGQLHEELQREAHLVCQLLLQTSDQISRGVVALCAQAQSEGYVHVEIVFRPTDHCKGGLTALEALDVAVEAVQSMTSATSSSSMTAGQSALELDGHLLGSFTAGLVISIDASLQPNSDSELTEAKRAAGTNTDGINTELIHRVIEMRGGSPFAAVVENKSDEGTEPASSPENSAGAEAALSSAPGVLAVSLSGGVINPSWLTELKRSLCPVVVAIGQQQQVESRSDGLAQISKIVDAVQLGAARIRKLCTTLSVLS